MIDFRQTNWPPDCDQQRIDDYVRRVQLFESEHTEAFADRSAALPEHLLSKKYLIQDYPKLISTVFADLLFGEQPIFSLPGQQAEIDQLVTNNDLGVSLYEGELSASMRGDAVFKASVRQSEKRVVLEEYPASAYFVELNPHHCKRIKSQALAWEIQIGEQKYLVVEHHEPGWVTNEAFRLIGGGRVGKKVPLAEVYGKDAPQERQETRVNVPLLFHIPNWRHGSRYWGMSDYTLGLETLFDEANDRLTQISEILDDHAKPQDVVPEGTLRRHRQVSVVDLEVIEVSPEEAALGLPRKNTWDAQLTSAFRELEVVADAIFKFSEVSPAIFGEDKAGSIESGRAMLFRFSRTLAKVARKARYWEPRIKQMFWVCQLLKQAWLGGPAPAGLVEVTWRRGLPLDARELTDVAVAQVGARIMSRHTAIRLTRQVGDPEAEAELGRIDKDEQEHLAPAGAGQQLPPDAQPATGKVPGPHTA